MTPEAEQLVIDNVDEARRIARRRVRGRQAADVQDAESAAVDGLIGAAIDFEPDRGVPFMAFSRFRIIGAVVDWQRANHVIPMRRASTTATFVLSIEDMDDAPSSETPEEAACVGDLLRVLRSEMATRPTSRGRRQLVERRHGVLAGLLVNERGIETAARLGIHKTEVSHIRREIREAFAEVAAC